MIVNKAVKMNNTQALSCVNTYIIKSYTFNESVISLVVLFPFDVLII